MKPSHIIAENMKAAKSFQDLVRCIDDMLYTHAASDIDTDILVQAALRQKPPKNRKMYAFLARGLGETEFPGDDFSTLSALINSAISTKNVSWISALLDYSGPSVVSVLHRHHKFLSWPKVPRNILYKVQSQIFDNGENPDHPAQRLAVNAPLLGIMWNAHPHIISRLGHQHVQMLEQAQACAPTDLAPALTILKKAKLDAMLDTATPASSAPTPRM